MKEKRRRIVLFAGAVLAVLILAAVLSPRPEPVDTLFRSDTEEREETLTLTGDYGGVRETRDVAFTVNPREETAAEQAARLEAFLETLPERILGKNASLSHVFVDLVLPEELDGIRIEWAPERPDVLDSAGTLYPEAIGEEPVTFGLTAEASLGEETRTETFEVTVGRPVTEAEKRLYLAMRMDDWTAWAAGEPTEEAVRLASETADGIRLSWERKGVSFVLPAAFGCAFAGLLLYEAKRQKEKREAAVRRRALERAYPGFLDELVLYLNAGLVLQTAVVRIAESRPDADDAFYGALRGIVRDVEEKNVPLRTGFRAFARETQLPQLLRFSSVLDDAVLKGVGIASKLELEVLLLRNGALRTAAEKGRKAETKLAFPLALLLGALLLVTLAPVLLGMG